MFRKATPKVKDELILIFDIGSSSVGGALFVAQQSGIPKIIYSFRDEMPVPESLDVNKFLTATLESLKIVAKNIHDKGLGAPDKVFCILSSPWRISQTRFINLEKNADFIFTARLADELVQKEVALFEEQHKAEYKDINGEERTIELKNIKTCLNGYDTPQPLNQKTKSLQMTIFVSISPLQILESIENTISKFFSIEKLKYISSSLSSFIVVRDLFTEQKSFLLVDIGGELTDISMTKKEILRESISFPFGTNFLVRGLSRDLKCSLSEANSTLSLYRAGHASTDVINKIEPIIGKLKSEWLSKFQESLANLSNDISIPANIYVTVEKDWATFFSELIKSEQFNQYTLAEAKFQITILGSNTLHGIANFEDNVVRDPFLIIGSVYINRHIN